MRRREIFIELTSLLDVILILLFLLLTQVGAATQSAQDQADRARERAATLEEELEVTRETLSRQVREERTLTVVEENSRIVTLSVYHGANPSVRVEPQGEAPLYVALRENWEETAPTKLMSLLTGQFVREDLETGFLVFQYDRTQIYHREYEMIQRVIGELKPALKEKGVALCVIEVDDARETG